MFDYHIPLLLLFNNIGFKLDKQWLYLGNCSIVATFHFPSVCDCFIAACIYCHKYLLTVIIYDFRIGDANSVCSFTLRNVLCSTAQNIKSLIESAYPILKLKSKMIFKVFQKVDHLLHSGYPKASYITKLGMADEDKEKPWG